MRSFNTIAFVETVKDVDDICLGLQDHGAKPFEVGWVPVQVEADLRLRQRGLFPISSTELLSIEDRERIFLDAVDWACGWLKETAIDGMPVTFSPGFSLTDLIKDNIYHWFDHLFYLITLMEKAIKQFHPRVVFLPNNNGMEKVQSLDIKGEYFVTRVGKKVCQKNKTNFIVLNRQESGKDTRLRKLKSVNWDSVRDLIFKQLSFLLCRDTTANVPPPGESVKARMANRRILIIGSGTKAGRFWRLQGLVSYLKKWTKAEVIPIFHWSEVVEGRDAGVYCSPHLERVRTSAEYLELKQSIDPLVEHSRKADLFSNSFYQGVDLKDLCNQKLHWILEHHLPTYWLNYLTLRESTKNQAIDLVFGASNTCGKAFVVAALHCFDNQRIPTLLCPHSIHYCMYDGSKPVHRCFELRFKPLNFTFAAVLG